MMAPMALTQKVKTELAAVATPHPNARRAEVATMLRFGGGLHLVGGRIVIEAELDSAPAARRLRTYIHDLYSLDSDLLVINATGLRRTTRYAVRVIRDGEALARLTGLVDQRRRPVRGLPAVVVGGSIADSVAVWRGHRRPADPDGGPGNPPDLGGTPHAARGQGPGEPACQFR